MAETFDYDVFLSYSSRDRDVVHALAEQLRDSGLRVWLDDWVIEPGASIPREIQRGVERSRVLLMCMSDAYFASDWASLEHYSLLFRDPANDERRFIPVLLANCDRPYAVAQFAYVDWREPSGDTYKKLLRACRADRFEEPAKALARSNRSLVGLLPGHQNSVRTVAITPDGKRAISGSYDDTLRLWDPETERLKATLGVQGGGVYAVAVTPDGKRAISGSVDHTLKLWDLRTGELLATFESHRSNVAAVAVTHDGRLAISGSYDDTIKLWDLESGRLEATLSGHNNMVRTLAITPDGKSVISGSSDTTLKLWDLETGRLEATLEGHSDGVEAIAVTPDGKRAISGSRDDTLKLWDLETGRLEATLQSLGGVVWAVAVTPDGKRVISGSNRGPLKLWNLPPPDVAAVREETTQYINAKVVLVGESGVGKTGLAMRLAENDWRESSSTHGMKVWPLDLSNADDHDHGIEREVWLWDFAGQPDYRLIHQLYMDETALALMVFDPQKEKPFEPLGHWEKALVRAVRHDPVKLLVAARCDRGGLMISQRDVDDYRRARGYGGYVSTAAKTGDGCEELRGLIAQQVPWDRLPWTATTKLFKALKDSIVQIKDDGIVLTRFVELRQRLQLEWTKPFEEEALRAVVGLLAGQGIVQKLDFGDCVLLQPEIINDYASAIVRAARESPSELAEVPERDVLDAKIDFKDMPRLEGRGRRSDPASRHASDVPRPLALRSRRNGPWNAAGLSGLLPAGST